MKVTTKQLSVCACGFPVLADHIPLGTEYEIEPTDKAAVVLICGGCKKHIRCVGVWVEQRGQSEGGYLPEQIFQDPLPKETPSITCPKCHRTSYNANDILNGYCGHCHEFTGDLALPVSACPTCGYQLEAATVVGDKDKSPKPEDFSLCMKCGEILRFKSDLSLRPAELNDFLDLPREVSITLEHAQKTIRRLRLLDKKPK